MWDKAKDIGGTWTTRTNPDSDSPLAALVSRFLTSNDPVPQLTAETFSEPESLQKADSPPAPTCSNVLIPPGAKLYLRDDKGHPCAPADCFMWTWEGSSRWYHANVNPPPHGAADAVRSRK